MFTKQPQVYIGIKTIRSLDFDTLNQPLFHNEIPNSVGLLFEKITLTQIVQRGTSEIPIFPLGFALEGKIGMPIGSIPTKLRNLFFKKELH